MRRIAAIAFLVFLLSTAYLAAHATASIFYMANVLFHIFGGAALAVAFFVWKRGDPARWLLAPCAILGAYLAIHGALRGTEPIVAIHALAGLGGAVLLLRGSLPKYQRQLKATLAAGLIYFAGAAVYQRVFPNPWDRIHNPKVVPVSMEEEGAGPKSPFWPSSANTDVNGTIPSNFFMDSKLCGECHKDIYNQWQSSMHHFSSFNNKFYSKAIEHMQDRSGTRGSKWCAGCHDHAVFFNGRFDRPMKEQMDTPEAQNGLGCLSCHSIVHVNGSMGQGGFIIEYPPLHELASSRNPFIRTMDSFLTYAAPEPHRRTFLKPFMRLDSAEYCSACHKVHLDVPVNSYRWLRGFNDYDNWQASGVSGQGARSFYYPPKSSTCSDCHMPLVASSDPGNRNGNVHSHRFAAANTAVAYANRDETQLAETRKFLQSGFISVDIFAASPVDAVAAKRQSRGEGPQLSSTFAVGEEAEQAGEVTIREVGKIVAPLDRAPARFEPGQTIRIDVVVRTRKIGHFFPGGTVDAFDVWLELEGKDARGRSIFHSGVIEDNGRGPIERGAHFYRSYLLDAEGNHINKRNAWQARSTMYVRLIPPGAADVAHYRLQIPKDAAGPISLEAKLNYRKFAHYYTQFVYGEEQAPNLPVITLASAKSSLAIGGGTDWKPAVDVRDRERWNDWGIGLLLQGDIKGAEFAFQRVTEAEPAYADGWLNAARALIQEGETNAAKPYLAKAVSLAPNLGRVHFFRAMAEKSDGDYDAALRSLQKVTAQYPRDRVALNQIGRLLFLKRDYAGAIAAFDHVLEVDPEDVQAHYNLMLACRGMNLTDRAAREERLFRRFKADEASQSITATPRLKDPEVNNERQQIHDHVSIQLSK